MELRRVSRMLRLVYREGCEWIPKINIFELRMVIRCSSRVMKYSGKPCRVMIIARSIKAVGRVQCVTVRELGSSEGVLFQISGNTWRIPRPKLAKPNLSFSNDILCYYLHRHGWRIGEEGKLGVIIVHLWTCASLIGLLYVTNLAPSGNTFLNTLLLFLPRYLITE